MSDKPLSRGRLANGFFLAVAVMSVFAALTAASASAATHWAVPSGSAGKMAAGNPDTVTGSLEEKFSMSWTVGGAGTVGVECSEMQTAATAENPTGGGSGTLSGGSLALKSCVATKPAGCTLTSSEIKFNPLIGQASEKGGFSTIKYEPAEGSYFGELTLQSCNLTGYNKTYKLSGGLSAREHSSGSGVYEFNATEAGFTVGGELATLYGSYHLKTSNNFEFYSSGSFGTQYWYGEGISVLAEATPTSLKSGAMSFVLNGKVAGIATEITCSGGSNAMAGTVENPSGGGAGTASGAFTFSSCTLPAGTPVGTRCNVVGPEGSTTFASKSLSGVAAAPKVTFSPASGKTIAEFKFTQNPASEKVCPLNTSVAALEGSVVATTALNTFALSGASGLTFNGNAATITGQLPLKTEAGQLLRLAS